MPSDEIQKRLNFGALVKEAQIALREVLEQRGSARDQQEALSPEAMSEENSRQPSFIGPKGNQASTLARRARRTRH
jgi:hypothetical protein